MNFNSSSSMATAPTMAENSIAGSWTSEAAAVPSDENSKHDEHAIPSFHSQIPWQLFDANVASGWTDPSLVSRRGNSINLMRTLTKR